MKKFVIFLLIQALVLVPGLLLAADQAAGASQKNEIRFLNSLNGSKSLLSLSGGRCWQTCADNDYGHLNCTTTCDDDSGSSNPGGGSGENVMLSPLAIGLYCVLLGICIYWLIQSAQLGASLGG